MKPTTTASTEPGIMARIRPRTNPRANPRARSCARDTDERGAATVFVVLLATAMLACGGLVIDGGYALAARRASMAQAEQAARVASDKLSESSLRSGQTVLVTGQAQGAAQSYLANAGAAGSVSISGDLVTVTVRDTYQPAVLSMVGVGSLDVSATATATSISDDGL